MVSFNNLSFIGIFRKIGNRLLKKSSAKKNSGKKNSVKKNTAKKAKPTPKKKAKSEAANFKRALFQSPDQLPNTEAKTPTNRMARPKRNLFTSSSSEKKVNDNGKRVRTVTKPLTPRKRVNRSLSFRESHTDNPESSAVPSTSYIAEQKCTGALQPSPRLSNLHKQVSGIRDLCIRGSTDQFTHMTQPLRHNWIRYTIIIII